MSTMHSGADQRAANQHTSVAENFSRGAPNTTSAAGFRRSSTISSLFLEAGRSATNHTCCVGDRDVHIALEVCPNAAEELLEAAVWVMCFTLRYVEEQHRRASSSRCRRISLDHHIHNERTRCELPTRTACGVMPSSQQEPPVQANTVARHSHAPCSPIRHHHGQPWLPQGVVVMLCDYDRSKVDKARFHVPLVGCFATSHTSLARHRHRVQAGNFKFWLRKPEIERA